VSVFTRSASERAATLLPELAELTERHRGRSAEYARILAATGHGPGTRYQSLAELPWLPVRLFKTLTLKSIPDTDVFKVLTSSGTTGDVSRVYLDRDAAAAQTRMLSRTMQTVLGTKRLPMLVIDTPAVIKNRTTFSARGAGVLGMLTFGRDHVYLLD
jgi:hypothetical protein